MNVTLIDDGIARDDEYLVIGLSAMENESASVSVVPGKNQTVICIRDDDHGTCNE